MHYCGGWTKEWGEDRGEGQSKETNAPPLHNPLLHRMEERELLWLRLYRTVFNPWLNAGNSHETGASSAIGHEAGGLNSDLLHDILADVLHARTAQYLENLLRAKVVDDRHSHRLAKIELSVARP